MLVFDDENYNPACSSLVCHGDNVTRTITDHWILGTLPSFASRKDSVLLSYYVDRA
jgi:hypothetical protein